jgi:hypothetical protein
MSEVRDAAEEIRKHADSDANIVFGASFSGSVGEDVVVTLMATGLDATGARTGDGNGTGHGEGVPGGRRPAKRPPKRAAVPVIGHVAQDGAPVGGPGAAPSDADREPEHVPTPDVPAHPPSTASVFDDDDFEIPSFIRRKAARTGRALVTAAPSAATTAGTRSRR